MSHRPGDDLGDRYLPGPQPAAGQEIRAAAGLAGFLRAPRRLTEFRGPLLVAGSVLLLIVVATVLRAVL
jgi:hypothetical protein